MTDYLPEPGAKVLLTVRAEMDPTGHYIVRNDAGEQVWRTAAGNSYEVRVEPAPIPVPTELGAVILAETTDRLRPERLMLVSGGPYNEDPPVWVHVSGHDETYRPSDITRVHAVLLAGDPS